MVPLTGLLTSLHLPDGCRRSTARGSPSMRRVVEETTMPSPELDVPLMRRLAHRSAAVALAVAAGLLACAALMVAAAGPAWAAPTAETRNYPDASAPCDTTLQACIDGSTDGDTILIAAGTYITRFTLDKAVSLVGAPGGVTLQALPDERVGVITGTVISNSVIISGLTFADGHLAGVTECPQDCGGGLLVDGGAQPLFMNVVISDNSAFQGGGLYATSLSPLVMIGGQVLNNRTVNHGGGLTGRAAVDLTNVLVQNNQCTDEYCQGGGLLADGLLTLTGTQFIGNRASAHGGGVFGNSNTTVTGGLFQDNQCLNDGCNGGGMSVWAELTLIDTDYISNSAQSAGGGAHALQPATLSGGLFQENHCASAAYCDGGGFYAGWTATVTDTHFISNTASGSGGGLRIGGWGVVSGGLYRANQCTSSDCWGGGIYAQYRLALTGAQLIGNSAGGSGGGLYVWVEDGSTVFNNLFAANTAVTGTAITLNWYESDGIADLVHNTFAAPSLMTGTAIYVITSTVNVTNNLFANFSTAIFREGGSASEDYNLYSNVPVPTSGGVTSGGNSITGQAGLGGDYRLTAFSDAIDAGTDAGIDLDFEGDGRPQGGGFDIGWDETDLIHITLYRLFLPLVHNSE
jgi:hypothetical protein